MLAIATTSSLFYFIYLIIGYVYISFLESVVKELCGIIWNMLKKSSFFRILLVSLEVWMPLMRIEIFN